MGLWSGHSISEMGLLERTQHLRNGTCIGLALHQLKHSGHEHGAAETP